MLKFIDAYYLNYLISFVKATCQWYHRMNAMTKTERSSLPKGPGGILEAQPARPTLVDRWILSRLAFAAASCNEGFESYDFPKVCMC